MRGSGVNSLIMQNRLISQARSGARTRQAATGSVLNKSAGNKKSTADSVSREKETAAIRESKENYTAIEAAAENLKKYLEKIKEDSDKDWEKATPEEISKYRSEAEYVADEFVKNYNDLLAALSEEDEKVNDVYGKQLKNYVKESEDDLKKLGITQEKDGALKINKEAFAAAELSDIQKIFGKESSFAEKIKERAENISASAKTSLALLNSSLYTGNNGYNRYGSDVFDILTGGNGYNVRG